MSSFAQQFNFRLRGRIVGVKLLLDFPSHARSKSIKLGYLLTDEEGYQLEWKLTREELVALCREASRHAAIQVTQS